MKAKGLDAYKGVDVTGKILVANTGLPEGVTRSDTRGEPGEAWQSPASYAAAHGALGVVLIPDFQTLSALGTHPPDGRRPRQRVGRQAECDARGAVPVVTASPALVSAMFEGERLRAAEAFERAQAHKGGDAVRAEPTEGADASPSPSTTKRCRRRTSSPSGAAAIRS